VAFLLGVTRLDTHESAKILNSIEFNSKISWYTLLFTFSAIATGTTSIQTNETTLHFTTVEKICWTNQMLLWLWPLKKDFFRRSRGVCLTCSCYQSRFKHAKTCVASFWYIIWTSRVCASRISLSCIWFFIPFFLHGIYISLCQSCKKTTQRGVLLEPRQKAETYSLRLEVYV
jgi:hypothetical protein